MPETTKVVSDGVTELEAAANPRRSWLPACTVNVYGWPLVKPNRRQPLDVVSHAETGGDANTIYMTIGSPPVVVGGVHDT